MHRRATSLLSVSIVLVAVGAPAVAQDEFGLPSAAQLEFLESLTEMGHEVRINSIEPMSVPDDWPYLTAGDLGVDEVPLSASGQLVVGFTPDAAPEEIAAILEEHRLSVIQTVPQIGMVVVEVPILSSDVLMGDLGINGDPLARAAERLAAEQKIYSVAPNVVLTPNLLTDAFIPEVASPGMAAAAEEIDWGIEHARIDGAWPLVEKQTFRIGVIDVGFASHEDIDTVPGLPLTMPAHNHGNHVSGIICAKHNNIGVKGVLPNCTAVVSTSAPILDTIEDQDLIGFYTLFGELLATVVEFIEANPDVQTINLSLGYNWFPNFRIDPTGPDYAQIRDLVRSHGAFFAVTLNLARSRGIAIVSAAGNDSSTLPVPTDAQWASPFNWAAKRVAQITGWSNGIVVEAHDQSGTRAPFSNVGGNISAPGVSILSALATTDHAYGRLSGTSMASPYVAGALALLRAATPNRTLAEHVACLLSAPAKSSSGVAMLDLSDAIARCN